ncbi:dolichyl-P-Man:Man(7)GlcNAc(2)-PP-dolichol alpha-1,6-mannosyltransferase [Ascosphaera acerosa]|nr:dolichyl-P-Man:Man(7)GlcNAc(2)-PP-dolichol alpha-1,6-mannosyltransferase [Ascosphaera acerosa]
MVGSAWPCRFCKAWLAALAGRPPSAHANLAGQLLVRRVLGLANGGALVLFARGLQRAYAPAVGVWYLLLLLGQFHVPFYASRPLPNMLALAPATAAYALFLPCSHWRADQARRDRRGVALLVATAVVLRAELALLAACVVAWLLARRRLRLRQVVCSGIKGAALGLLLSVPFDSVFWGPLHEEQWWGGSGGPLRRLRLRWPELDGFVFNVLHGRAADWGVSPWHAYFAPLAGAPSVPRILFNPATYALCLPFALARRKTRRHAFFLLLPSLAFVALYGAAVAHKEWRFVVYVVPPVCGAAAMGAAHLWAHRRGNGALRAALAMLLLASVLASAAVANFLFLPASMANYPGGVALLRLQQRHAGAASGADAGATAKASVAVWMDTCTCQTGVTRWLEVERPAHDGRNATWRYDRTEDEGAKAQPGFFAQFDYLIVERALADRFLGEHEHENESDEASTSEAISKWEVFDEVEGYAGLSLARPGKDSSSDGDDADDDDTLLRLQRQVVTAAAGGRAWAGDAFARAVRFARRLARGYWVEMRTEPKVVVLRRRGVR